MLTFTADENIDDKKKKIALKKFPSNLLFFKQLDMTD